MPTHQTRSSAADRSTAEPLSPPLSAPAVDDRPGRDPRDTEHRGWKQLVPELPEEVIALLSAPVVVAGEAGAADAKGEAALRAAASPAPTKPAVDHRDLTPRFLAPHVE